MIRAGVVGSPAKHSLSPLIHTAWLKAAGIDGQYGLYDIEKDGLAAFLQRARGEGLRGVNVTLPFKEQALNAADEASDTAHAAGAANLLLFEAGGRIRAHNTDGEGLLFALASQAPGAKALDRPVAILGAGGAAKGAAAALAGAGVRDIRIVNRTAQRAEQLAADLMMDFEADIRACDFDEALKDAGLLINAATAGLGGQDDRGLDLSAAPDDMVVMDMVYSPLVTPLLAQARARSLPVVDGLEMLIGQAIPSFEAFFGQLPPRDVDVRALALAELGAAAMKVIGLTGSIGMGKSTTAALFAAEGVPVHDADAEVHALYDIGGKAVPLIGQVFPGAVKDGKVDRATLSARVMGDAAALKSLEEIVHPLMGEARAAFFEAARQAGADLVLVDVPLLFETGGETKVDVVVVVSAPEDQQRERVMTRGGMSAEKLAAILSRQMPDAEKRRRADYVIDTGHGIDVARDQVRAVIAALRAAGAPSK